MHMLMQVISFHLLCLPLTEITQCQSSGSILIMMASMQLDYLRLYGTTAAGVGDQVRLQLQVMM